MLRLLRFNGNKAKRFYKNQEFSRFTRLRLPRQGHPIKADNFHVALRSLPFSSVVGASQNLIDAMVVWKRFYSKQSIPLAFGDIPETVTLIP